MNPRSSHHGPGNKIKQQERRHQRLAAGLCRDCGQPAALGRGQCQEHLEAAVAYAARRRAISLATSICGEISIDC